MFAHRHHQKKNNHHYNHHHHQRQSVTFGGSIRFTDVNEIGPLLETNNDISSSRVQIGDQHGMPGSFVVCLPARASRVQVVAAAALVVRAIYKVS